MKPLGPGDFFFSQDGEHYTHLGKGELHLSPELLNAPKIEGVFHMPEKCMIEMQGTVMKMMTEDEWFEWIKLTYPVRFG